MSDIALLEPPSAAHQVRHMIPTRSAVDDGIASSASNDWVRTVERLMHHWRTDAMGLGQDDLIPPTPAACERAADIAWRMEMQGQMPPTRIVLDTDGGLSFELEIGGMFQSIDVLPDGSAELIEFQRGRLISRQVIRATA